MTVADGWFSKNFETSIRKISKIFNIRIEKAGSPSMVMAWIALQILIAS